MAQVQITDRGMNPKKQKVWIDAIEKENKLRLKWFNRNEKALEAISDKPNQRDVPEEMRAELKQNRIARFQNVDRHAKRSKEIEPFVGVDTDACMNIMKPVDPNTEQLIYAGTQKDGRINYLTKRYKILPEDRYYFPETSSFIYGWKMWNCSKEMKGERYGRRQVIKDSFYRRRGVERDPDWYKEPFTLSPNVCNCS